MLNLSMILENSAREYPEKTAIILDQYEFTYSELNVLANKVANGLHALGVRRGDKVVLSCPNIPYFPIAYYGILKAGAVVVPLNVLLKRREIAFHLADSDARVFVCFEGNERNPMGEEGWAAFQEVETCEHFRMITADPMAPSPIEGTETFSSLIFEHADTFDTVQTRSDDTAVIIYTSGTTGRPKGAELTHSNLLMNAFISRDIIQGTETDVAVLVLPLFHSLGQTAQMNAGVVAGSTLVLQARFSPGDVLHAFQERGATLFCGVPAMYHALVRSHEIERVDLEAIRRTMRLCVSGGAPLPVELINEFESTFQVPILEGYGLTETSPVASFNQLGKPRKPGSVGLPIWGVEMRVVDSMMNDVPAGEPGEIVIRGHNVMKEYYKHPEATDEAMRGGWFHTGDIGKQDDDGYFYVVDRSKDMIIRGGINVYPREIEETLMTHPHISVAAVIGVPCEKYGETIKAFVVPEPKVRLTAEDVIAWIKKEVARYKCPQYVEIRDSLPMNAIGKVLKRELREGK